MAVGKYQVPIPSIGEADFKNLPHPRYAAFVTDRGDHFHPILKIPSHPVSAAQVPLPIGRIGLARRKVKDARMFKESANNTDNLDVVTEAWNARSKQAEPADDQLDFDASARSARSARSSAWPQPGAVARPNVR